MAFCIQCSVVFFVKSVFNLGRISKYGSSTYLKFEKFISNRIKKREKLK